MTDCLNVSHEFIEGAKWADEHPKNPWRDAKTDPPEDTNAVVVIFGDSPLEWWICSYSPIEKLWDISDIICNTPKLWMSIPELPKQ